MNSTVSLNENTRNKKIIYNSNNTEVILSGSFSLLFSFDFENDFFVLENNRLETETHQI